MADDAQNILTPLPIDNALKASAWEAFNSAKNTTELQVKLMVLKGLSDKTKADLWEAKNRGTGRSREQQQIDALPDAAKQARQTILRPLTDITTPLMEDVIPGAGGPLSPMHPKGLGHEEFVGDIKSGMPGLAAVGVSLIGQPELAAPAYLATKGLISPKEVIKHPYQTAIETAIAGLPVVVKGVGKLLPSAKKAGQAFAEVSKAAGKLPVDVSAPGNVALETQRLAQSGGKMPKVMSDFLRRVTDPKKPPLTYDEARDFFSNATRLSIDELNRLTPVMKRQVAIFTDQLKSSTAKAAEQAGKVERFHFGMKEYSKAARIKDFSEEAKDLLMKKILPYGAAGAAWGAGYNAAKKVLFP